MEHYHKADFRCANCQQYQSFLVLCNSYMVGESGPACIHCGKKELACLKFDKEKEYPLPVPSPFTPYDDGEENTNEAKEGED